MTSYQHTGYLKCKQNQSDSRDGIWALNAIKYVAFLYHVLPLSATLKAALHVTEIASVLVIATLLRQPYSA